MTRKFKIGDRVRPVPASICWALRSLEDGPLDAVVTRLGRTSDPQLDLVDIRFDDDAVWIMVTADHLESAADVPGTGPIAS